METPLKRIGKQQYADKIGVTEDCLRKMLNREFFHEMKKTGYKKTQKHLTIAQIERLEELAVNIHL
ncbi:MAG: hypothetical protein PHH23_01835 [Paludibacteraceae bacterium]|nr:hypothetical protein [Paludibacteraceae bacterium]